jgi:tetratricopeptide (TPR) repeat protein
MKGPDRFQAIAGKAAAWVAGQQKRIALAVAVLVGLVAVAVGAAAWQRSRGEKAGALLYRALDALDGLVTSAQVQDAGGRPVFRSVEEQRKAVIAVAGDVRREYPSSAAAHTAALASGDAHSRLGEWDAAMADYEVFLKETPVNDSLRFGALDGLAHALEGKGDLEKAAQAFERLGAEVPFMKGRAGLERARLLAKAGKVEEARKLLESFPADVKDPLLEAEARDRLARLGGK